MTNTNCEHNDSQWYMETITNLVDRNPKYADFTYKKSDAAQSKTTHELHNDPYLFRE